MGTQRIVSHQLLSNLLGESRVEPASDVNLRKLLVFAYIVFF